MTTQITIIGLGQIGASVGLALGKFGKDFLRIGFDTESGPAGQAKKMGAVDKLAINLPSSVRKADVVLLALPIDQVRKTLELIAEDVKENAIILDTSPVRSVATEWAADLLPQNCHYVGFTPMINPLYLHEIEGQAHPDLFDHGLMAITAPQGVGSIGLSVAAKLAELLGATPLFCDIREVDSHMAALHVVPQLLAGTLSMVTTDQPGWQDGRKFAGRAYALASSPIDQQDSPAGLAAAVVMDKVDTLRILDGIIAALKDIRAVIEKEDTETLEGMLVKAREGRQQWWADRGSAQWPREGLPTLDPELTKYKPFGRWLPERKKPEKDERD
jgi:prephenate dehydrogenase